MERYAWASALCGGKNVLDAACGTGFGTLLLSAIANSVFGVDISQEAIAYAKQLFTRQGLSAYFIVEDLQNNLRQESYLSLYPENMFDVIVSFETIEHLENPELWISQIPSLLKAEGMLICSVPLAQELTDFHKHTFTEESFRQLIADAGLSVSSEKTQEGDYRVIWAQKPYE
jgi:2-polyprenyl-3-methyl-5-hydroxy-6-metoxy-1,4-benzoquinol methylase